MLALKYLFAATLFLCSATVSAHNGIKSSSPEKDQVLSAPPEQVALTFNNKVHLLKIRITDSEENKVDVDFKPSTTAAETFEIALPDLKPEQYQVQWSIMSKDGHKISKSFGFTVGAN